MKALRDWIWLVAIGAGAVVFLFLHFAQADDVTGIRARVEAQEERFNKHVEDEAGVLGAMKQRLEDIAEAVGAPKRHQ